MAKKKVVQIPGKKATVTTDPPIAAPVAKQGRKWRYWSTEPNESLVKLSTLGPWDWRFLFVLVIVSLVSKLWKIGEPSVVVFDEAHTVNHINKYIDGVYFNDVTPPLTGLFYTFVAYLAGYRGEAPLKKPGEDYLLTTFPYKALRSVTGVMGTLVVVLCYLTLRCCGVRDLVALACCLVFAFENIAVIESRLFMPDALFMLGVALSVYAYKKFELSKPMGKQWIKALILTGVSLGLTVSTKWIGLATISWTVVLCLVKLWYILGDLDIPNGKVAVHTGLRIAQTVLIPFICYFGVFAVHIMLLTQFHNDASLVSTDFQRELIGNDVWNLPKYVTWNSTITMRHVESLGGYLHSHPYKYKSGSKEQQVTLFDFKDFNNEWLVEPAPGGRFDPEEPRIKNGQEVMLRHKNTGAVLRVDQFKPPMSEQDYDHEVSCVGNFSFPGNETTDKFFIKFKDDSKLNKDKFLTALDVEFRLQNTKKKCTVLSHDIKLPEWGFNQQEVICVDTPNLSRTWFRIENVKYPKDFDYDKFPFLKEVVPTKHVPLYSKFFELNYKMYRMLQGIKSTNKNASSGGSWPWLLKGVKFSTRQNSTLYVIGNPVTFILPLVLIPVFVILCTVGFIKGDTLPESLVYKSQAGGFVLGYLMHLLPYCLLPGEFFLQYYLPALYFGVLLAGVTLEFVMRKNSMLGKGVLAMMVLMSFHYFSNVLPVTWGTGWTNAACEAAKLFDTWDFRCDKYA